MDGVQLVAIFQLVGAWILERATQVVHLGSRSIWFRATAHQSRWSPLDRRRHWLVSSNRYFLRHSLIRRVLS